MGKGGIMENARVVKEEKDKYILETEGGKRVTAMKINRSDVDRINHDLNMKVAKVFEKEHISEAIEKLEKILNNPPSVTEYKHVAENLTDSIKRWYDIVGNPNLFHHPRKNIDIEIYGRAENFIKQVSMLLDTMYEVADLMVELGKIEEIRRGYRVEMDSETMEKDNEFLSTITNWIDTGLIEIRKMQSFTKIY